MPDKIPNWINEICSIFPCMIHKSVQGGLDIDVRKVINSLVVVAIIAASTSFVTVKVLESQFSDLKANINFKIERIERDHDRLIMQVDKFEEDITRDNTLFKSEITMKINDMERKIR